MFYHEAQKATGTLPALLLQARRVASTVIQGAHGRRRIGTGESFWQYKMYEAGDDTRHIDWKKSARSQDIYIRQKEWEAAQSLYIAIDTNAGMDFASKRNLTTKMERARLYALALSLLALNAGERVCPLSPINNKAFTDVRQAGNIAALMENEPSGDIFSNLALFEHVPRNAHLVLFSDFLGPLDDYYPVFELIRAKRIHGLMVQILDPAEYTLPYDGHVIFQGMGNNTATKIQIPQTASVRDEYHHRIRNHINALSSLGRRANMRHILHLTDQGVEVDLLRAYRDLSGDHVTGGRTA